MTSWKSTKKKRGEQAVGHRRRKEKREEGRGRRLGLGGTAIRRQGRRRKIGAASGAACREGEGGEGMGVV